MSVCLEDAPVANMADAKGNQRHSSLQVKIGAANCSGGATFGAAMQATTLGIQMNFPTDCIDRGSGGSFSSDRCNRDHGKSESKVEPRDADSSQKQQCGPNVPLQQTVWIVGHQRKFLATNWPQRVLSIVIQGK